MRPDRGCRMRRLTFGISERRPRRKPDPVLRRHESPGMLFRVLCVNGPDGTYGSPSEICELWMLLKPNSGSHATIGLRDRAERNVLDVPHVSIGVAFTDSQLDGDRQVFGVQSRPVPGLSIGRIEWL